MDRWRTILKLRLRSLFRADRVEQDLHEEYAFHVDRATDELVARGVPRPEARRQALLAMGGIEASKEVTRDTWRVRLIQDAIRDLRYALRLMRRNPSFAAVATASLMLGIGANTAIFQLLDAVRLRPLPVPRAQDLSIIQIAERGWPPDSYSSRYPDLTFAQWERIRDRQRAFSGVAAWANATFDLSARGESRFAETGIFVSGDFFKTFGIQPALGRLFTADDDIVGCAEPGVVLSHDFWRREFGGSVQALGAPITVNAQPLHVIGVAPAGFFGVEVGRSFDLAVPLCADDLVNSGVRIKGLSEWWLNVIGRRAPGVTPADASASLAQISPSIFADTVPPDFSSDNQKTYRGFVLTALPGTSGVSQLREQYDASLWLLLSVAGVVLLIACANLANLLLARMAARDREIVVRLTLGASRARLVRQLLVESLLLAFIGAAGGVWLAPVLGRTMVALISSDVSPMFVNLATDGRLVLFTGGLTVITCLLFGLLPALRATRTRLGEAVKSGGRGPVGSLKAIRLRRALVVAQIALSLALVVAGLLFGRSLRNLLTVDAGFQSRGVLEADIDMSRIESSPADHIAMHRSLLERLRALPAVQGAATASTVPFVGNWYRRVFIDEAGAQRMVMAQFNRVSPGYFDALKIPLVMGHDFNDHDVPGTTLAMIVNDAFVRQFLPNLPPIGLKVKLEGQRQKPGPDAEIVGVVRNTKYGNFREEFKPLAFLAQSQLADPGGYLQVLMRTSGPVAALMPSARQTIESAHPNIRFHFHDFDAQLGWSLRQDRLMALLCGVFAILGALLAAVGVYGVMSYSVAERSTEIGVRLALGAAPRGIVSLVVREAAILVGLGVTIGVVIAVLSSGAAAALLFGLAPRDVTTIAAASVVLAALAFVATYAPARRAARVDPMTALRHD